MSVRRGDLHRAEAPDDEAAAKVRAIVGDSGWTWLTVSVREVWERDLSRDRVRIDLDRLEPTQVAAMADFLGWRLHRTGAVTIDLHRLDGLLRESGLRTGLAATLVAAGGPLRDAAGDRRSARLARAAAEERLWSSAADHAAVRREPRLAQWLADERTAGRLPAEPADRARVLGDALVVLAALPHRGTGLARLAQSVLGRAHALDRGPVAGAVLRGLCWLSGEREVPTAAAARRAVWASAGVAVDTVSSTVLTLGLTVPGHTAIPITLRANAAAGLAVRLTLAQLTAHLEDSALGCRRGVFVCENPSVVEEAAMTLGPACPPLICVEGRPSVAGKRLLAALQAGGAELRYHGDFDWAGVQIAADLIGDGASPWRFGAPDYRSSLVGGHPQLPQLGPSPAALVAQWDSELVPAMVEGGHAVEEEQVIEHLIADLAAGR